jgi:hypothetical protein
MPTYYVHKICSLEIPLLEFVPLQHLAIEEFRILRTGLLIPPRTPLGFGYPLCVLHSSITQALFHAWNALGVHLSEPFSGLKAEKPFGFSLLLCSLCFRELPSFYKVGITGNCCFEALLLKPSGSCIGSFYTAVVSPLLSQGFFL